MLNHIVKAAGGAVSHNAMFDALFGIERPDFLANCPVEYINKTFAEMTKIIDLKAFKKEANDGFSAMGLEDDLKDCIVMAIGDAKTSTEVARLIYGIGVYLLTDMAETNPEMVQVIAKRWTEDGGADKIEGDGFYTQEAEQAMFELCERVFGKHEKSATEIHEVVVEEPVAEATVVQQTAPAEKTEVKPAAPATIRGIKPQHNHKNNKKSN